MPGDISITAHDFSRGIAGDDNVIEAAGGFRGPFGAIQTQFGLTDGRIVPEEPVAAEDSINGIETSVFFW